MGQTTHGIMTRPRCIVSGLRTVNHDRNQWATTSCSSRATIAPLWKKSDHQFTLPSPGWMAVRRAVALQFPGKSCGKSTSARGGEGRRGGCGGDVESRCQEADAGETLISANKNWGVEHNNLRGEAGAAGTSS